MANSVSRTIAEKLQRASWIRKMFEEGVRLKQERGAENIFDFTLGNPEVEPPAEVIESLARLVRSEQPGLHAYMPSAGFPDVRAAVAGRLEADTGLPYTANHVLMTVGAAGAINTALKALIDPGDEVITLSPFFVEYAFYAENHGGVFVLVETRPDFQPDLDRIAAAITPRTKAIILNSPNNPTGVIYPEATLRALGEMLAAADHPITVISDEPYKALTFDGAKCPEVALCIERTLIATSWSKALAVPGERIGYLAISPRLPDAAELFNACCFTLRTLGFVNAPALWQRLVGEMGDRVIDIAPYQEKRDLFYEGLTRIGYRVTKPGGAFYLFPETPNEDDIAFVGQLQEEGILAVPGSGFGRSGHMRLSLTVPRETIERSLPGFERVFEQAHASK